MRPNAPSGLMLIQSISNLKIVEFTVPALIDQLQIDRIHAELVALMDKSGHPKMVVSFEGVKSISSAMLGTLITLHKKAKENKGELRLAHIAPQLEQVFKMTNLHKLLTIYKTTDDAVKKF